MTQFSSVDEVLDFAIGCEQEAVKFYLVLADMMKLESTRKVIQDFSKEEEGHEARLKKMKATGEIQVETRKIQDMKMESYVVSEIPHENMDYGDALALAIKKEDAAWRLYMDLAGIADKNELKTVFHALAAEEAEHKERFEKEYEDACMREN